MRAKILGSAAGGGFPQWNCACVNCISVRTGQFPGKPRLQTQVAVTDDGVSWFLLGASPDLHRQIQSDPELQPSSQARTSPLDGVVLASADLDHVLGLLLLRELHPFNVWTTEPVIDILRGGNTMFGMLNRAENQVRWNCIRPDQEFRLQNFLGRRSSILCHAIALSSRYPPYAKRAQASGETVLGLVLTSQGRKLGFFPQLPILTAELTALFATLDCLLLDGTFWTDDELIRLRSGAQTAREMGHIPVGGEQGTLRQVSELKKPRKIYIHINNTNPMLNEAGPEYRAVREMGWELAEDGWQLSL